MILSSFIHRTITISYKWIWNFLHQIPSKTILSVKIHRKEHMYCVYSLNKKIEQLNSWVQMLRRNKVKWIPKNFQVWIANASLPFQTTFAAFIWIESG